jgi:hypothetical protein
LSASSAFNYIKSLRRCAVARGRKCCAAEIMADFIPACRQDGDTFVGMRIARNIFICVGDRTGSPYILITR